MIKYIPLIAVVMLVFAGGCYYDSEEVLYPNTFCDTVNVTYSGAIAPIIADNCLQCHSSGGTGFASADLTSYSGVMVVVESGSLLNAIRRTPSSIPMPPDAPLRSCDVKRIELWIADGAPNN